AHCPERVHAMKIHPWRAALPLVAILVGSHVPPTALAQPFDSAPETLRVMSWNVEWMFDDDQRDNRSKLSREQSSPSRAHWNAKLDGVADAIAAAGATIVGLQEIEGLRTLADIAERLESRHDLFFRYAMIPGTDTF